MTKNRTRISLVEKIVLTVNAKHVTSALPPERSIQIGSEPSIYNPYSIMKAVQRGKYTSYWQKTGAYDSVVTYISMNFDGLKDDVVSMLAGGRCPVDTTGFSNDMHDIRSKDDVFTVLIHLGYLSYDEDEQECYIPNKEVGMEMVNAVESCKNGPEGKRHTCVIERITK